MTTNPPLYGLPNATTANGTYTYSTTPTFPTSSFNATNYYVDAVFSPES